MAAVTVVVEIDRTPEQVWAYVRDLGSHVEWMADATEIRFLTDQREGTGTSFECDTKVGPIKLTDVMTITNWVDEAAMGVRHEGVVTGVGEFTLTPIGETGTHFSWREDLSFPIWLGGPIGEIAAKPILTAIWRRNLTRLKANVEQRT
ncbi:MAG: SRPBCC family protein [Actinomycetota bacterium]